MTMIFISSEISKCLYRNASLNNFGSTTVNSSKSSSSSSNNGLVEFIAHSVPRPADEILSIPTTINYRRLVPKTAGCDDILVVSLVLHQLVSARRPFWIYNSSYLHYPSSSVFRVSVSISIFTLSYLVFHPEISL